MKDIKNMNKAQLLQAIEEVNKQLESLGGLTTMTPEMRKRRMKQLQKIAEIRAKEHNTQIVQQDNDE